MGESSVRFPARPGLFTEGDDPALIAGRCNACAKPHFPHQQTCPYCSNESTSRIELSTRGTLWAWTAVTAAPPGYHGEVPYGFGVVELPEGIRVLTRLTEPDPANLVTGQPMELVLVPLPIDDEGGEAVVYAFSPAAAP